MKKEIKKGVEWFKLLSEKEQQEFKENCDDFDNLMRTKCYFTYFINECFIWSRTKQGWVYWSNISRRYK